MTSTLQKTFSFGKSEHLCGEIRINKLFADGSAFICYPLRVVYKLAEADQTATAQVMVSVPKKRFKRAVKRNRLKRLMRESYRLNKTEFIHELATRNLRLELAFNYVSDDVAEFEYIQKKMKQAFQRIISALPEAEN